MKLSDTVARTGSHVILYGDPKCGKSTLAAQLAEVGYKLWWISLDNGHAVLHKLSAAAQENVELIVLPDTKENPIGIVTILRIIKGGPTLICDTHGIVDCATCKKNSTAFTRICLNELGAKDIVVYDHISGLSESALNLSVNAATAKLSGDEKKDNYKVEWDDYRVQGTLMTRFLLHLQQARYNAICIAHVTEAEMDDGKKRLSPQIGTRDFSRNSGKYFDHVVYMGMRNRKHVAGSRTDYDTNAITGSRTDVAIEDLLSKEGPASLAQFFTTSLAKARDTGLADRSRLLNAAEGLLTDERAGKQEKEGIEVPDNKGSGTAEQVDGGKLEGLAEAIIQAPAAPAVAAAASEPEVKVEDRALAARNMLANLRLGKK
jgi:hypothetical protein